MGPSSERTGVASGFLLGGAIALLSASMKRLWSARSFAAKA